MTKTNQFGMFMISCQPIVEELADSVTIPEMLPIAFVTSFYEVCDEHWRSLEPRTVPKLDPLRKMSALRRSLQVNLDKFQTMKSLDCHLTPRWWLMLSKKS